MKVLIYILFMKSGIEMVNLSSCSLDLLCFAWDRGQITWAISSQFMDFSGRWIKTKTFPRILRFPLTCSVNEFKLWQDLLSGRSRPEDSEESGFSLSSCENNLEWRSRVQSMSPNFGKSFWVARPEDGEEGEFSLSSCENNLERHRWVVEDNFGF